MVQYKMWIAGKWVDAESGKTYPVFNPATEAEIAQLPLGDKADVDKAVEAARKAFPIWSKKPQAERSQIAMKIAALLRDNAQELGRIDTLDHGTPAKRAAFSASVTYENFEWAAYNARSLMGHTIPVSPESLVYLQREPIGVVALITPWNLPLMMVVEKLAPALTLGNTCIIKPPSIDSLAALKLAELLETLGLPPGTVNVITGPGSTVGEALSSHRGVDMVAFTGSSETGKEIMAVASQTVKRLQMELGGKNPVIGRGSGGSNQAAPMFAVQLADVEVDGETGKVKVLSYTAAQDVGFAINPTLIEGQIQGAVAQGIGRALMEDYVFQQGIMQNPNFLDYRMPTAVDLPFMDVLLVQVKSDIEPFGVRGVGEPPMIPTLAAIANAIHSATGMRLKELPMTPEIVLKAMRAK